MPAWLAAFFTAVLRPLLPELGRLVVQLLREERLARRRARLERPPDAEDDADLRRARELDGLPPPEAPRRA